MSTLFIHTSFEKRERRLKGGINCALVVSFLLNNSYYLPLKPVLANLSLGSRNSLSNINS